MKWRAGLLLAAALILPGLDMAEAQQANPPQQENQRPPARRRRPVEAQPAPVAKPVPVIVSPQEKPLAELSEAIGALSFLTQLCSPGGAPNPWRARMEALVEAEGDNSGAKDKMMGAYNRGFSEYSTTYRQCTDAARAARRVLTRDAARLSRDLERRFGS